jgi:hypothetical protein
MSGSVPPSSRARGRNVRRRAPARGDVDRAADLYERFTGHDPRELGTVNVPELPRVAAVVGECDGVLYTTVRDGKTERYIHEFAARDRPLLCVSPDGRQILLVGGRYRFTEAGIVDASDKKHRHLK